MTGIKQAVILAGGEGTRLRPLTDNVPKPMVRLNDRPFLEYLIDLLKENVISEVVLLLGYLPEKIIEHFGDGSDFGIDIKYSAGEVTDETGTRLRNAAELLDEKFLLIYGDNYWPLDLKRLLEFYKEHNTLVSTTVYANKDDRGEYGAENNICVDDDGYVVGYDKNRKDKTLNGVDIGFFLVDKQVLEFMPGHNFSFEEEILPLLAKKRQLSGYVTQHRYHYISTPESLKVTEKYLQPRKVVLLDRDGVINRKMQEGDYVKTWEEFEFLPGVVEALKLLTRNGYDIYIITNQRGIARGIMTMMDVEAIHQKMTEELAKNGVKIDGIYVCPHGEDDGCDCRKPKPGLLFQAASAHDFNLTKAVFIGDKVSDMQAGEAAGCKTILVEPGKDLKQIVAIMVESDKRTENGNN